MNVYGAIVGLATFAIIGVFHPIVTKTEYHFGVRVWPVFLVAGVASIIGSLFVEKTAVSAVLGVLGFSSLWSIRELHEQTRRVEKGWFPKKPHQMMTEMGMMGYWLARTEKMLKGLKA